MPRPPGLVVWKASKIRSTFNGSKPIPESRTATRISSPSPRRVVITRSRAGSSTVAIASMAFRIRFTTTCCSCTLSPITGGRSAASSVRSARLFLRASLCVRMTTSSIASFRSNRSFAVPTFLKRDRIREMTSPARLPSRMMRRMASPASERLGGSPVSQRRLAFALVNIPASGWLTS